MHVAVSLFTSHSCNRLPHPPPASCFVIKASANNGFFFVFCFFDDTQNMRSMQQFPGYNYLRLRLTSISNICGQLLLMPSDGEKVEIHGFWCF